MKVGRRRFIQTALAGIPAVAVPRIAWSQAYPVRPVRIVAGFAPGGQADLYARLIGQLLSERFGRPFVVENRVGATGSLAAESVSRAAPDGHTLLLTTAADAWNTAVYNNLRFNYVRDLRTGRKHRPWNGRPRRESIVSGEIHPGTDCLRQSQQDKPGVGRGRGPIAYLLGPVWHAHRCRNGARTLSGLSTGSDRSAWRSGARDFRYHASGHRIREGG